MISITNLKKSYAGKELFRNVSLSMNAGEKIGLIGPNGSGKSTLFSLILGEIEPSSGEIMVNKNTYIGYLPQESSFHSQRTVLAELTEGDDRIRRLKEEKARLEEALEAASERYGEVVHSLEALDYLGLEHKAKKILMGLGFREKDFDRPINAMSGGWQMRALLGKLLTYKYDLLLLDEPTNYLDLNAALWLKEYLKNFKGTFIMISHDKAFLNEVTNYTLVLENGVITKVRGNYEHYEAIKEEKRKHALKQFKEQEKKRLQLERFVQRFHAQPNKAASVRAKRRVLERMTEEAVVVPQDQRESIKQFSFPATVRSGHRVITLKGVCKSYPDTPVYSGLDFEITQDEKAVLAGENGAGKSTLLKILAGVIDIDSGERLLGHNVEVGYFSQTRLDVLNPENSVLEEAYSAAPGYMSEESIRTVLGAFLFTGDDSYKKVSVLSGGEKSRLILTKLLINPPNFLLLDEPTTHLDVDAVDALLQALLDYRGTIVFISHDIYFTRTLANKVFEVKGGRVRKFAGGFDYYLEKRDTPEVIIDERKQKIQADRYDIAQQRQKAKEEEKNRKIEEKKRKEHNRVLGDKIRLLEKKKEGLRIESVAKARALSDPRFYHDEERAADYGRRLKEIECILGGIDKEIKELEGRMI